MGSVPQSPRASSPPTHRIAATPRQSTLTYNKITGRYQYADGPEYVTTHQTPRPRSPQRSPEEYTPRLDELALRHSPQRPSAVASLALDRIGSPGPQGPRTPGGGYYSPRTSPALQSPRLGMAQMRQVMSPRLESPRLEYLQGEIEALKHRQMDQLQQAKLRALQTREQVLAVSPSSSYPGMDPPQTYRIAAPSVSTLVNQAYLSHGAGHRAMHSTTTPR